MEIDQADFALINAVSRDEWLAYLLNGDVDMESIMNMPGHGILGPFRCVARCRRI
jgi:hypothetical protein